MRLKKTQKKPQKKPDIEREEILSETERRGYEMLRLTRIKYVNNPLEFIDIRLFQRGTEFHGDEEVDVFYPTKKGVQLKEEDLQRLLGQWTLAPTMLFHPILIKKSLPALKREEFDTAVFRAFKAVEVRVRELGRLPKELVGIKLMRKAFDAETGPLAAKSRVKAENDALANLFAGAIGWYKNPVSHRDVDFTFREAIEMLLVASHLLFVLDRLKE